ncbi:hypothetical protein N802_03395 [Knoellia sinensis KCTC 19936]|uniref:HTH luxR-type domain-containing protein n=2 Tax=Knoellia TaxID=136099 RepID=A0A0A0J4R8_9MICO|nr:hypothetical protein N802_03395 [Knoellia sinensis KCTC 19936]
MELAHEAARGTTVLPDVLRLLDRVVGVDVANSSVALAVDGTTSGRIDVLHTPPLTPEEVTEWMRLIPTHPYAVKVAAAGLRSSRLTDHMRLADLDPLEVYDRLLRPRGSRYQLAATLSAGPTSCTLVSLWRWDRDFTDDELAVVEQVRRALAAALAFHEAMSELRGLAGVPARVDSLTPRQADVCALVARGLSNAQVGLRLGITERTVRKHLEDVFARTGCTSRSAVAVWWHGADGVADAPLSAAPSGAPR